MMAINQCQKIAFAVLLILFFGCGSNYYSEKVTSYLNLNKANYWQIYGKDEIGGCHGEGHSIELYELTPETIKAFIALKDKSFYDSADQNSKRVGWFHSPIDSQYIEGAESMLRYYDINTSWSRSGYYEIDAKKLLSSKNEYYYALRYKNSNRINNAGDIEFFLLDPKTRLLYIFENSN